MNPRHWVRCALSGGPPIRGRAGFTFALRIGVQGLCTKQGTNETQPLNLVRFVVPSASGWGAGLAPDRCHPMRPACLPLPWCGAPVLALVPVLAGCWPCPCSSKPSPLPVNPCHWVRCALSGGPPIRGRAGLPFALRIGVQGLCTKQGTNETQPLNLVRFVVPSASGWGAGLAPDRCHPMRPACLPACLPALALVRCPCAGAGARVGWVLALPLFEQAQPLTCEPVPLGAMRPEWWPADKGAGGASLCAANRCARLLHHARYKPSPPVLTW